MKNAVKSCFVILISLAFCQNMSAQNPAAPIWGVYASGVGEPLKVGMDPCQVTYTVALMTDPNIVANIGYGTSGAVATSVTWKAATALQSKFSQYQDDEPDGIYKLTPCHLPPFSANGVFRTQWGPLTLRHSGGSISGTYGQSGKVSGGLNGLVLTGTWTEGSNAEGDFAFTFSPDGSSFTGKWRSKGNTSWYNNWHGTRTSN